MGARYVTIAILAVSGCGRIGFGEVAGDARARTCPANGLPPIPPGAYWVAINGELGLSVTWDANGGLWHAPPPVVCP